MNRLRAIPEKRDRYVLLKTIAGWGNAVKNHIASGVCQNIGSSK